MLITEFYLIWMQSIRFSRVIFIACLTHRDVRKLLQKPTFHYPFHYSSKYLVVSTQAFVLEKYTWTVKTEIVFDLMKHCLYTFDDPSCAIISSLLAIKINKKGFLRIFPAANL